MDPSWVLTDADYESEEEVPPKRRFPATPPCTNLLDIPLEALAHVFSFCTAPTRGDFKTSGNNRLIREKLKEIACHLHIVTGLCKATKKAVKEFSSLNAKMRFGLAWAPTKAVAFKFVNVHPDWFDFPFLNCDDLEKTCSAAIVEQSTRHFVGQAMFSTFSHMARNLTINANPYASVGSLPRCTDPKILSALKDYPILYDYDYDFQGVIRFAEVSLEPGKVVLEFRCIGSDLEGFFTARETALRIKGKHAVNLIIEKNRYGDWANWSCLLRAPIELRDQLAREGWRLTFVASERFGGSYTCDLADHAAPAVGID
jgi:hypothetical protein